MQAIVLPVLNTIAHIATDKATTYAKDLTRQRIIGAGLGRLANAVGSDSSLKIGSKKNRARRSSGAGLRGSRSTANAWGAVFARGGSDSRGNQALLAYSQGATITPGAGKKWLAFATDAIPKRVGRRKITPALYRASGLVTSIGKLTFVAGKKSNVAYLVARNQTVSRRNGRTKSYTGRTPRGADRKREVVAFILIKITSRAKRIDQPQIMKIARDQIPRFARDAQAQLGATTGR